MTLLVLLTNPGAPTRRRRWSVPGATVQLDLVSALGRHALAPLVAEGRL